MPSALPSPRVPPVTSTALPVRSIWIIRCTSPGFGRGIALEQARVRFGLGKQRGVHRDLVLHGAFESFAPSLSEALLQETQGASRCLNELIGDAKRLGPHLFA